VLVHAADGTLDQVDLQWDRRFALGVVVAATATPTPRRATHHRIGAPVADARRHMVFHRRHRAAKQDLVTSGGRVLCVTALGDSAKRRSIAPTRRWRASASTACSTGATSATARSCAMSMPRPPRAAPEVAP
jgi:phosphoribosylamine-glycine ligase